MRTPPPPIRFRLRLCSLLQSSSALLQSSRTRRAASGTRICLASLRSRRTACPRTALPRLSMSCRANGLCRFRATSPGIPGEPRLPLLSAMGPASSRGCPRRRIRTPGRTPPCPGRAYGERLGRLLGLLAWRRVWSSTRHTKMGHSRRLSTCRRTCRVCRPE